MNILYISHVLEQTGWAKAAEENMLALESAGHKVISRNLRLTYDRPVSEKMQEFLNNDGKPDVCIQHILPHHMEYTSAFPCIAYYVNDTLGIPKLWERKLKLNDTVWCPNVQNTRFFDNADIVPHPTDLSKYKQDYGIFNCPSTDGTYIFYAIVDFVSRKNIEDLLRAFYSEFKRNEPVSLVIKTSKFNTAPDETLKILNQVDETIKRELKLYKNIDSYKKAVFITNRVTDEQLYSIHQTCNCYVDTSHGEAFCLPMFDAFAFGNQIVTSDVHKDYLPYFKHMSEDKYTESGVFAYDTNTDMIHGYTDTFFELGNANDSWLIPDLTSLRYKMRKAYTYNTKIQRDVSYFSHENIGKLMTDLIKLV